MSKLNNSYINIGRWNIQGMKEYKLHDKTITDYIEKHDCGICIESWLNENISINNYYTYCLLAKKSNRGRPKGGTVITMKHKIKKCFEILQTFESHNIWLKMEKTCFKLQNDLSVCVIYVPPIDSQKEQVTNTTYGMC